MDRDRYKQKKQDLPKKRPINSGEKITFSEPVVIKPGSASKPKTSPIVKPEKPLLFDDDDDDIFGVWKKQKELKKRQKAEKLAIKATKKAAKQQAKLNEAKTGVKRIDISVSVPSATKLKRKAKRLYNPDYKKQYIIAGVFLMIPITVLVGGIIIHSLQGNDGKKTDVLGTQTSVAAKPDFNVLKPKTTETQATSVKYDTAKKVASYNDVLDEVPITVSQQPLPDSFKSDPTAKVEEFAKQINATDKISTGDATAFSGVSAKGPQTIVFTKNDLLVFIYADKKIDTLSWSKYIANMY